MYGNGNGNGYPGYGVQEDYYDRMNRAKPVTGGDRDPFIDKGPHRLALLELFEYPHQEKGPTVKARFQVLQSTTHPVGSIVTKLWFLAKPAKFPNQPTDGDKFADFAMKLKGIDPQKQPGYPIGNDIRTLLRQRVGDQPARGTVIDAKGVPNKNGTWVEIYWTHVDQAQEQVVQMRQQMDANPVYALSEQLKRLVGGAPAAPQQMPYQGAPHPSQMAGAYPAQMAATPPMQQYAPPQGQFPPPGYGPQAGTPLQQQYAPPQPMQSPVPPAPQQGPGFAAQIPPQGNNPGQGGNGW